MKKTTLKNIAVIAMLLAGFALASSCQKGSGLKDDDQKDSLDTLGFIPKQGLSYHYKFKSNDGQEFPFYKRVSGSKDSLGVKLYEVTTYMSFFGEQLTLKQKMFNKDFFTTTAVYKVEEWERYVNLMRKSLAESGGALLEVKVTGVPFYMLMENDARVGSKLNFTGALEQKLYIKARSGSGENAAIIETDQTIVRNDGTAVKQEKITVPAGTYECIKWQYSVNNKVQTRVNGYLMSTLETKDDITVWTTPRIGEVKVITVNSKSGQSSTELVSIGN